MQRMKRPDCVEVDPSATLTLEEYMALSDNPAQTPPILGLKARLDKKTGRKVLCGRLECDGQLATIRHRDEADFARIHAAVGDIYSFPIGSIDYLEFPPGWTRRRRSDEVWELSAHALKRARRGLTPKLRKYPNRPWIALNRNWNIVMGPSPYGYLPVTAVCPQCGWRNAVIPEVVWVQVYLMLPTTAQEARYS